MALVEAMAMVRENSLTGCDSLDFEPKWIDYVFCDCCMFGFWGLGLFWDGKGRWSCWGWGLGSVWVLAVEDFGVYNVGAGVFWRQGICKQGV